MTAAAAVVVACSGDGSSSSSVDAEQPVTTTAQQSPADESAVAAGPALDSLDLGWRTECAWAGAAPEPADTGAAVARLELDVGDDLTVLYEGVPESDVTVRGGFEMTVEGEDSVSGGAEVELRGRSSRGFPKRSFDLRLDRLAPGLDTDRLSINAMYTDPAMVREHLSMRIFDQLGVVSPQTSYVDLFVDDGYEGLYLSVQRVDDRLLAGHGIDPTGATLVRDRTSESRRDGVNSMLEPSNPDTPVEGRDDLAAWVRSVTDTRGDPDWEAVVDLVEWTRSAAAEAPPGQVPDASASAGLGDHFDVDALVRFAIGQTLVGDADWGRDDYWLARAADDDARFLLVPWDKDLSFGTNFSPVLGTANHVFDLEWDLHGPLLGSNPLMRIALADPAWRDAFHDQLGTALDGVFSMSSLCDELAEVAPVVEERADLRRGSGGEGDFRWNPKQHWAEPGHVELHLSTVIDYAQRRAAFLRAQIARVGEGLLSSPRTEGPMTATAEIGAADAGTSVLFTDASGWTIARLDVTEVITPGTVTVSVVPDDASPDVDRRWQVVADAAHVQGRLNLYYRNYSDHNDWFRSTPDGAVDLVGDQFGLAVATLGADGSVTEIHESSANPFADRVMARLDLADTTDLTLVVPEG